MSYRADKQVIDTHTLTDRQTWDMTIPEGQNWPRVTSSWLLQIKYIVRAAHR